MRSINWFHTIDLGGGLMTPGKDPSSKKLATLDFPADLTGKTVLDIGAWDGFFSFEAERRGASRVLATDQFCWGGGGWGSKAGFEFARRALHSKVEDREIDPMDLSPRQVGTFDVVLFLGVFYHLRSPISVLERIRGVTAGTLILETHALVPAFHEQYPLVSFFPGDGLELGLPHEFCSLPTMEALRQMLRAAGFSKIDVKHTPSMRWLKKLKAAVTTRPESGRAIIHAR
jgi:tRNA (mo5U34)-methyltransferase